MIVSDAPIDRPMTARQRQVLNAIVAYWREHGIGPTLQDVADATGISSKNGVVGHVELLRRRGLIETDELVYRSIWPAGLRAAIRQAAEGINL